MISESSNTEFVENPRTGSKEVLHSCYYFAYGSNNNPARMKQRGVVFSKRQMALLKDYEFILNKTIPEEHKERLPDGVAAANIRPAEGKIVYGVLYKCAPGVYEKLDVFEGVSTGHYKRVPVIVTTEEEKQVEAITYVAGGWAVDDNLRGVQKEYLDHILCGRDLFPNHYVEFLESFRSWCK